MVQVNCVVVVCVVFYVEDYDGVIIVLNVFFMNLDVVDVSELNVGLVYVYGNVLDVNNLLFYLLDVFILIILCVYFNLIEDVFFGDGCVVIKFVEWVNNLIIDVNLID